MNNKLYDMSKLDYDLLEKMSLWCPEINNITRNKILELINYDFNNYSPISYYVTMMYSHIKKYNLLNQKITPPDMMASGMIFFYGCIMFLMSDDSWNETYETKIEDVSKYLILYMIADNYIDSKLFKNDTAKQMKLAIHRKIGKITDLHVKNLREIYLDLISRYPHSENFIIDLFYSEIDGLKIQNNENLSEEDYFKIACEKGGKTFLVLNSFTDDTKYDYNYYEELKKKLENNMQFDVSRNAYYIGALMQLFDDCLDVEDDMSNDIHTVATWHYKEYGNLDKLWQKLIKMVLKLDSSFNSFKLIYSQLCTYVPGRVPHYYSNNVINWISKRNIFPDTNCSKYIVDEVNKIIKINQIFT